MKTLALLCIFVLFFTLGSAVAENLVVSGISPTTISLGTYGITTHSTAFTAPFPVATAQWVWKENWLNAPAG
jgi:hypothetical protein